MSTYRFDSQLAYEAGLREKDTMERVLASLDNAMRRAEQLGDIDLGDAINLIQEARAMAAREFEDLLDGLSEYDNYQYEGREVRHG